MTYDHNQLEVPESFVALFVPPGRSRPSETREVVTARYELCENLASHLTEPARALHHDRGVPQDEVLATIGLGLRSEDSGLSEREADWVVRRLAELEGWPG